MRRSDRRAYIEDLADVAEKILADGSRDPSAEEIARRDYHKKRYVPDELVNAVRRNLKAVRQSLEERGHKIVLLPQYYYEVFRGKGLTPEEARLCSCYGTGKGAAGLAFVVQGDENLGLILKEQMNLQARQVNGGIQSIEGAVLGAVQSKLLTAAQGRPVVRNLFDRDPALLEASEKLMDDSPEEK